MANVVKNELATLAYTSQSGNTANNEMYTVPIQTVASADSQHAGQQADDQGQQIIQQFQFQLPDQAKLFDHIGGTNQTQQIQIIQTDPNNPDQPQVITLYTWGGN